MANIKSQQKRNRTNERARLLLVKFRFHRVRAFHEAAQLRATRRRPPELLASTNRKLDKAAGRGRDHKNRYASEVGTGPGAQ